MTDRAVAMKPPPAWRLWDNPIFRRYCRSRLRAKGLTTALLLPVIFSAFAYLITPMSYERTDEFRTVAEQQMRERAPWNEQERQRYERQQKSQRRWGVEPAQIYPKHMYQRRALIPLLV